jgi:NitT/TauT family transport system permease protein
MRHINRYPQKGMRLTLMLLPFVVLIAAWFMGSAVRLEANPQDKLLPGLSQMVAAIDRMAFTPDKRSGEYLLWADTLISLSRLLTGLAVSSLIGLVIGIAAGVFPMYRAALSPLLTVVSMIPPLAILPVLFIVFGLDELSKVMLIVIGITPMLARDLEQRAQEIPAELFIKAQTLGANSWTLVLRVVLPQLLSRLITSAPAAGLGMAVPDLRRGHLRHRRAGVPHFPGAALYGDGRDYSLCHLDHLAGMADGSGAAPAAQSLFPVGGRRPGMSFIDIKNIWQEYGDHVVLERINLQVKEGEFCSMVGASGCGKSTFLRLLLGQEKPTRGAILLDGQPLAAEPDRSRGVVFQRYSVFPHLNVLDNVAIGLELPASPLLGRLFGGRKREARQQAQRMLEKVGWGTPWINTRRSSPAGCNSGWPLPRRS